MTPPARDATHRAARAAATRRALPGASAARPGRAPRPAAAMARGGAVAVPRPLGLRIAAAPCASATRACSTASSAGARGSRSSPSGCSASSSCRSRCSSSTRASAARSSGRDARAPELGAARRDLRARLRRAHPGHRRRAWGWSCRRPATSTTSTARKADGARRARRASRAPNEEQLGEVGASTSAQGATTAASAPAAPTATQATPAAATDARAHGAAAATQAGAGDDDHAGGHDRRSGHHAAGADRPGPDHAHPGRADGDRPGAGHGHPRRRCDGSAGRLMASLERRIGLLFAGFLVLLLLAGGRALWLGGGQGRLARRSAAATQQVTDAKLPAERGTIVDRKRRRARRLRARRRRQRHAVPGRGPDQGRPAARPDPRHDARGELVQKLARKDTGFVYLARDLPADKVARIHKLELTGVDLDARPPAHLPARVRWPRRCSARSAPTARAWRASSTRTTGSCAGTDGERRSVKDALGEPINVRDPKPAKAGARVELTLDAAIQDKVEEVLAERRAQTYQPKGATAIVMDPRTGEVLALANWPRVDANDAWAAPPYAHAEPRRRLHLRAGLDVQGVHRRRRARGRHGHARHAVRPAAADPGRRPDDRRVAPARRGDARRPSQILAQSSNVGAITIGLKMGARALRQLGAALRLRPADRRRPARRGARPRARRSSSTRARRWATCRSARACSVTPMQMATAYAAIANGGILRAAARRAPRRRRAAPRPQGRGASSPRDLARSCGRCSRASSPRAARRREVSIPGYKLAGKTGTANKVDPDDRRVLRGAATSPRSWASRPRATRGCSSPSWSTSRTGAIYGGEVAAPAFGQITSFALPYLRIPPRVDLHGSRSRTTAAPMTLRELLGDAARTPPVEVDRARLRQPRSSRPGTLFFCVPGFTRDGHDFAPDAVARGAAALVVERPLGLGVPEVLVDDVRAAMAPAAARFHGDPTARLTASASPARTARRPRPSSSARCSRPPGRRTGLLGTVTVVRRRRRSARWCARRPRRSTCRRTFAEMLDGGDEAVRDGGLLATRWRCTAPTRSTGRSAVFTNLTQDHLDFHADMEDYFLAKRRLFEAGPRRSRSINVDDPYGARLAAEFPDAITRRHRRARRRPARRPTSLRRRAARRSRVDGLRAALAAARALQRPQRARRGRRGARARRRRRDDRRGAGRTPRRVPGRFEPVDEGQAFAVLVDYAHTPDSLENVLRAARALAARPRDRRLRRRRRPRPRQAPADGRGRPRELADVAIVTSDNPRSRGPRGDRRRDPRGHAGPRSRRIARPPRGDRARGRAWPATATSSSSPARATSRARSSRTAARCPFDDVAVAREALRARLVA